MIPEAEKLIPKIVPNASIVFYLLPFPLFPRKIPPPEYFPAVLF